TLALPSDLFFLFSLFCNFQQSSIILDFFLQYLQINFFLGPLDWERPLPSLLLLRSLLSPDDLFFDLPLTCKASPLEDDPSVCTMPFIFSLDWSASQTSARVSSSRLNSMVSRKLA